jgi:hypothetical protein
MSTSTYAKVTNDFNIDDVEDAPTFVILPTGSYTVMLNTGVIDKTINDNDYFSIEMTVEDCLEVPESSLSEGEQLPRKGDKASLIFGKANIYGMSNFKTFVQPIARHFGVNTIGEVREQMEGLAIMVTVKRKYDKKRDQYNMNVVQTAVL